MIVVDLTNQNIFKNPSDKNVYSNIFYIPGGGYNMVRNSNSRLRCSIPGNELTEPKRNKRKTKIEKMCPNF